MKSVLKNIGIIVVGIIIGMIINMGIIILGATIVPITENFEPMNAMNWDLKYFIFPFLAHALGTFSGSFAASRLSKNHHIIIPLIVGLYFLSGGIYMVTILPAPTWFICLDLIISYIPMAILGWNLNQNR